MKINTLEVIKRVLDAEIEIAEDSIRMYYIDDEMDDVNHWVERLAEAVEAKQTISRYSDKLEALMSFSKNERHFLYDEIHLRLTDWKDCIEASIDDDSYKEKLDCLGRLKAMFKD